MTDLAALLQLCPSYLQRPALSGRFDHTPSAPASIKLMQSFSHPSRFVYHPDHGFQVEIPNGQRSAFYDRASPAELRSILAPEIRLTRAGNVSSLQPSEPPLRSYAWYLAQLVHYGLGFVMSVCDAQEQLRKVMVRGELRQPRRLVELERKLRKARARAEKRQGQRQRTTGSTTVLTDRSCVATSQAILPVKDRSSGLITSSSEDGSSDIEDNEIHIPTSSSDGAGDEIVHGINEPAMPGPVVAGMTERGQQHLRPSTPKRSSVIESLTDFIDISSDDEVDIKSKDASARSLYQVAPYRPNSDSTPTPTRLKRHQERHSSARTLNRLPNTAARTDDLLEQQKQEINTTLRRKKRRRSRLSELSRDGQRGEPVTNNQSGERMEEAPAIAERKKKKRKRNKHSKQREESLEKLLDGVQSFFEKPDLASPRTRAISQSSTGKKQSIEPSLPVGYSPVGSKAQSTNLSSVRHARPTSLPRHSKADASDPNPFNVQHFDADSARSRANISTSQALRSPNRAIPLSRPPLTHETSAKSRLPSQAHAIKWRHDPVDNRQNLLSQHSGKKPIRRSSMKEGGSASTLPNLPATPHWTAINQPQLNQPGSTINAKQNVTEDIRRQARSNQRRVGLSRDHMGRNVAGKGLFSRSPV